MRQTKRTKVPPVQREDSVDPFAVGQMQQRRIGELKSQAPVYGQYRGNRGKIPLGQGEYLKGATAEGRKEFQDRAVVFTQEPRRLGDDGPAGQQRSFRMAKLLDADLVVLVGLEQNGDDGSGIDQQFAGEELPNPSKYFGLVLRSRTFPFTAPINPACRARSYAVSARSSAAS